MRGLITALCLLLLARPAISETARVVRAELGDVTRIAIEFTQRPGWRAGRTPDGYGILFDGEGPVTFEAGRVLGTGEANRIAAIRRDGQARRIDLDLDCPCWARIYEFRDSSLVLDIHDGKPPGDAEHEVLLDEIMKYGVEASGSGPSVLSLAPYERFLSPSASPSSGVPMPFESPQDGPARVDVVAALPAPPVPGKDFRIEFPLHEVMLSETPVVFETLDTFEFAQSGGHAVEMLARELSRAVAQGLVDAPDTSRPLPEPSPLLPFAQSLEPGRSNLSITTAIDRDIGATRERPPPTRAGSVCLPDSEVDLVRWGDPSDRTLLGTLRTEAFVEDGSASEKGVLALTRYYLAMGFGAEAYQLAELISDPTQRALLQTLAEIMDHGESDNALLDGQVFCNGKIALWSMLAHPVPVSDKPADTDGILAAFSELPLHVRIHLGPVLSQRLRALDFKTEAQIALNAVTRGGGHSQAQELTSARLGLTGTTAETARGTLEDLSRGTDLVAAEALLELLLDAERRETPPDPAWVEDAPSLVRATQGTETAANLNLASLRGRIALGQFDLLREALNEWSPGVDDQARRVLASAAIGAAGAMAEKALFLRTELALSKVADPFGMRDAERIEVARRLMDLGLPDRALVYLAQEPISDSERQVRALALSDMGRRDEAIALLSNATSTELLSSLGSILLKDGRADEAAQVLRKASETEAASLAAIRDADWSWLEANAPAPLATASRVLRDAATDLTEGLGDGNADLLRSAAQRRGQAAVLLDTTEFSKTVPPFTN
jgi:tetratricopeptide (TPR) repeat protein